MRVLLNLDQQIGHTLGNKTEICNRHIFRDSMKSQTVSCSVVSNSATPWTVAHQAPLSTGLSRQEYWSRWPFPSPGGLLNPGIEPKSPTLQADSLLSEPPGKQLNVWSFSLWPGNIQVQVQFSRSVVSNSLHGLQHTRPPCPSLTLRVYSNSCPLSQ